MRKDDGTTPLAEPEWTASVRMSVRSVPPIMPRRDVVTHTARVAADEGWGETRRHRGNPAPFPRARLTLVVVAAARVEADDERRRADGPAQRRDVVRQVGAPRLLRGLDEHDRTCVRDALLPQSPDRRDRRKDGVAVVRATASVEFPVALNWRVGAQALMPPCRHGRLLIQVPIHEHRVVRRRRRDLDQDERRPLRLPDYLEREPVNALRLDPVRQQLDGLVEEPVRLPLRVKGG